MIVKSLSQLLKTRLARFMICGAIGGLVQIAIFHPMYLVSNIFIAYTVAFIISATVNYNLNSVWTFKDKRSSFKGYFEYLFSMSVTFLIGEILIYLFINILNINDMLANVITIPVIFPINYVIGKSIVWNKNKIENIQ
jgi:putative flippase GtrA